MPQTNDPGSPPAPEKTGREIARLQAIIDGLRSDMMLPPTNRPWSPFSKARHSSPFKALKKVQDVYRTVFEGVQPSSAQDRRILSERFSENWLLRERWEKVLEEGIFELRNLACSLKSARARKATKKLLLIQSKSLFTDKFAQLRWLLKISDLECSVFDSFRMRSNPTKIDSELWDWLGHYSTRLCDVLVRLLSEVYKPNDLPLNTKIRLPCHDIDPHKRKARQPSKNQWSRLPSNKRKSIISTDRSERSSEDIYEYIASLISCLSHFNGCFFYFCFSMSSEYHKKADSYYHEPCRFCWRTAGSCYRYAGTTYHFCKIHSRDWQRKRGRKLLDNARKLWRDSNEGLGIWDWELRERQMRIAGAKRRDLHRKRFADPASKELLLNPFSYPPSKDPHLRVLEDEAAALDGGVDSKRSWTHKYGSITVISRKEAVDQMMAEIDALVGQRRKTSKVKDKDALTRAVGMVNGGTGKALALRANPGVSRTTLWRKLNEA